MGVKRARIWNRRPEAERVRPRAMRGRHFATSEEVPARTWCPEQAELVG